MVLIIQKKYTIIIVSIVIVLLLIYWVYHSINEPEIWVGESNEGWVVHYEYTYGSKDTWEVTIFWRGEGDVTLHEAKLVRGGSFNNTRELNHEFSSGFSSVFSGGSSREFLTRAGAASHEEEYTFYLNWSNDEGTYEDEIKLKPRTRYFIPFH
ncbi:hypothetical protein [Alkalibacillus haloalkaliphilus]|uniref:DUF4944 domain-containing protein n=1 Tax=Alkalibacillus haloalkaliphilus TaxID=94136 RepID=A0A511W6X7_9BACI|nr:hypothetical protein [Alkalibacillus haloalkaliphilus]GEN45833.1 hypothetical protein AHA02nite_16090 [Alkalibacillus haloalkaliphilus]